jgi:hypothetical protein
MFDPQWTRGACLAVALCALGVTQADHPRVSPRPGYLVLRSDRVLRGDIIRVGDRYVVAVGDQDELRVPVGEVEFHCDTLEEAYELKRRALTVAGQDAAEHLKLANWCLRYGLYAAAAEQLMLADQREPDNEANRRFERRLIMAAREVTENPASASASAATTSSAAVPSARAVPDLDPRFQSMPAGTVEQFTNFVQPLLINRCGAGGCHGPHSSTPFVLDYPHWSRVVPRRFTQNNLHATLRQVNRDQPQLSPLLVMATRPHGGAADPLATDRDRTLIDLLSDWIHRAVEDSAGEPRYVAPEQSATVVPVAHPQPLGVGHAAAGSGQQSARAPSSWSPPPSPPEPATTGSVPASRSAVEPASNGRTDAAVGPADPATDPFDPEVFNRRYLPRVP